MLCCIKRTFCILNIAAQSALPSNNSVIAIYVTFTNKTSNAISSIAWERMDGVFFFI